jgi:hypothetical protein
MFTIIRQLDQSRNEIVHWHIGFTRGKAPGIGLTKPTMWPLVEPNYPSISVQDLIQFVDKADFIHRSLNIFFVLISSTPDASEAEALQALQEIFQQPASYPPLDTNPLSRNYKAPETPLSGVISISITRQPSLKNQKRHNYRGEACCL